MKTKEAKKEWVTVQDWNDSEMYQFSTVTNALEFIEGLGLSVREVTQDLFFDIGHLLICVK